MGENHYPRVRGGRLREKDMIASKDGVTATLARFYCRNRYAFWLGLVLFAVLIFVAGAMNTRYRCWQWKTDPLGAAILERIRKGQKVPRIADVGV